MDKPATCHPRKLAYAKGLCLSCYEKARRTQNSDRRTRSMANCRKYYQNHRDAQLAKQKLYRQQNPEVHQEIQLKRRYNLTLQQYKELLQTQNGVCAICGAKPGRKKLFVDHNHATNKVRGLLCRSCNTGLGCFQDDINLLLKSTKYLRKA